MSWRKRAVKALIMLCAALLASCWDKVEMNELALISMVGLDRNPENGAYTLYYQVINPASGFSAYSVPGSDQSPVYTYSASGTSFAEIQASIYKTLSRQIFVDHVKLFLVSRRAARQGMRDFMNYTEMQPDSRPSIPLLIVDDSMDDVMHTFTPLERNPSDAIISRLKLLYENTLLAGRRVDVRDIIERMERKEMIVIPLIAPTAKSSKANNWDINEDINANHNQLKISGGAVIRDYRMIGRLNDAELIRYHLLIGEKGRAVRQFSIDGQPITVNLRSRRVEKRLSWEAGKPVVEFRLQLEFSTISAHEYHPQSTEDIHGLENRLNRIITDELLSFCAKTRERGWDLLRIRSLLRRKAPDHPDLDQAAKDAQIKIRVETRFAGMGNLNRLYEGTGEAP